MYELIKRWNLNQCALAKSIDMPIGTFKNKLRPNSKAYKFSEAETEQLKESLRYMCTEILNSLENK